MELQETTSQAVTTLSAVSSGTLAAGEKLKAECGGDEMDETVPEGKTWRYRMTVSVSEEGA